LIFFISWYSDNYKKLAINESDKKNLIILALTVAFATTMIVSVSQKGAYTGYVAVGVNALPCFIV
jgi:hypothetical protein